MLVGLPGAGKSTVAQLAADLLAAPWHDLDAVIVAAAGAASVTEIFSTRGDAAFRTLEHQSMLQLLDGPPALIAAGGGWAAQPGNLAAAESRALSIYLSLPAERAAERLGEAADRPLLASAPAARMAALLAEREPWYRQAGIEIAAEAAPELVAAAVATAAHQHAGW